MTDSQQRRVADAVRRLRRRLVLRRRDEPPDGRRHRRPGQHGADPELRERLRGPQEQAPQLARRRALRRAARPRPEPARCTTPTSSRRRRPAGTRSGRAAPTYAGKVSIYDSSDLHRRRGAAPDDDAARSRHQEPVPAQRRPVRRGDRPARDSSATPAPCTGARYSDQIASYAAGDVVIGTSWQFQVNLLQAESQPIAAVLPDEGSTGWSDTWMIATKAKHPNCMYMWMDHMASAEANGQATVWFGEAPTSQAGLRLRRDPLARSLRADARDRRGLLRQDLVLDHPAGRLRRRRTRPRPARTRTPGSRPGPTLRGA